MTSVDTVAATTMTRGLRKGRARREAPGRRPGRLDADERPDPRRHHAAGGRRPAALGATDMEISLRVSLERTGRGRGRRRRSGAPARRHRAAAAGRRGDARAPGGGGVAQLTCGSASYSLHTYGPEDFPRLPEIDPDSAFSVEREAFLDTIARVGRSASRDESRPVLTGDPRSLRGGQARDGGDRLLPAQRQGDRDLERPGRELEAIVPARALPELARVGQAARARRSRSACRRTRSCSASTASG